MMPSKTLRDETTAKGSQRRRSIQSVVIGFRLITALEEAGGPTALKDLAAAARMSTSQAHAYLASLRDVGLVVQEGDSLRYDLGARALSLGLSALNRLSVHSAARDGMRAFRGETGEAVHLSVWSGQSPVIVSRLDGRRAASLAIRLGFALPLDRSASGRIFLAFSSEAQAIGHSLPSVEVEAVRRNGIAVTDGLVNAGFAALSVPIFDHMGDLVAALTTLGAAGHIDNDPDGPTALALRKAAQNTSLALGFRPTTSGAPPPLKPAIQSLVPSAGRKTRLSHPEAAKPSR